MQKWCFTFVFFIILSIGLSQDIDSLKQVSSLLQHDSDRINLFYSEGFAYRTRDAQYSYECALEAMTVAERTGSPFYQAKALNLLGILYYRRGDLGKALSIHRRALQLREKAGDQRGRMLTMINLGNIYSEGISRKLAETCYLEATRLASDLGDEKQKLNGLVNLGVLFSEYASRMKDSSAAKTASGYFHTALKEATTLHDAETQAMCYNNLSVLDLILGKYDNAISDAYNSIKFKELSENKMEMADSYLNIAVAEAKLGHPQECVQALNAADTIIREFHYSLAAIQYFLVKSDYYVLIGKKDSAYLSLRKHLDLQNELNRKQDTPLSETEFSDTESEDKKKQSGDHYPLIFINLLLIIAVMIAYSLFKNKR